MTRSSEGSQYPLTSHTAAWKAVGSLFWKTEDHIYLTKKDQMSRD